VRKIKDVATIAAKWVRVASTRGDDFKAGVSDASVQWAEPTAAAASSFAAGVQDAITRNAFAKGVNRRGTDHWRKQVVNIGVDRWPTGVRNAQQAYADGFTPVQDVIARTQAALPPRKPRGDPGNAQRSQLMVKALSDYRKNKS
jgi:hypothetical protein